MTRAVALRAPAKLNLFLRVVGQRADGYHDIETVFHAISLCDEIVAEPIAHGVELSVTSPSPARAGFAVPAGLDNLVHRAATQWLARAGARGGVRFHLAKHIPAGGGLGGGSSDAAAALRLLHALHRDASGPAHADPLVCELAAGLGSDVPFFLRGGTAIGRGRGERLEPVATPAPLEFVLAVPSFGTSTPQVYKNWRPTLTRTVDDASLAITKIWLGRALGREPDRASGRATPDPASPTRLTDVRAPEQPTADRETTRQAAQADQAVPIDGSQVREGLANDLEASAVELQPELRTLCLDVASAGHQGLRMSGSGSTCFLAFRSAAAADAAAADLTRWFATTGAPGSRQAPHPWQVDILRARSASSEDFELQHPGHTRHAGP